jgi:hypothetical protein
MCILFCIVLHKTPVFCALGCTLDQFKFGLETAFREIARNLPIALVE